LPLCVCLLAVALCEEHDPSTYDGLITRQGVRELAEGLTEEIIIVGPTG